MPEFETISVEEAKLISTVGRQGKIIQEYAHYVQQIPQGQAGKLHLLENEKPLTIRQRLTQAAKVLGIPLVIKRAGSDLYFWIEQPSKPAVEEQPKRRRGRRPRTQQETSQPDQLEGEQPEAVADPDFVGTEMGEQREPEN
jgi:hypothetical protein